MPSHLNPLPRGPAAVLVGLCPLLGLAPDAARALALALAVVSMALLTLPWWALRRWTPAASRWPTLLWVLAAAAGTTQLLLDALSHGLHPLDALGVPLVAANLALWSPLSDVDDTAADGAGSSLRRALGAAAALLSLGMLRELFARGTVFATATEYFGGDLWPVLPRSEAGHGLLLFAQPAGALFALACLMAAWQAWRARVTSTTDRA